MKLKYLILDLFFDQKIKLSHILEQDFDIAFNVESYNSTSKQRLTIIQELLKDGFIQKSDDDDYFELTKKGGQYWESIFSPNWQFYFELFSLIENDDISVNYFYAVSIETVEKFIQLNKDVLEISKIQESKNWQPIYWKELFDGFYVSIIGDDLYLRKNLKITINFVVLMVHMKNFTLIKIFLHLGGIMVLLCYHVNVVKIVQKVL